jgi:hypothetical protein
MRDQLAKLVEEPLWGSAARERSYETADAIIAALPDMVQPLVWEDFDGRGAKAAAWNKANYLINKWSDGRFDLVESYPGYQGGYIAESRYPTIEAAKAAAQADYTRRILSTFGITGET